MKTIKKNSNFTYEIVVLKSIFTAYIFHIDNEEEAKEYLLDLRKKNNKAKHIVFAYIIDDYTKSSDDGEPTNTAGKPILNLMKNNELNHCLIAVVRIFGGTLLGAGRLLRAYTTVSSELIKSIKLYEEINLYEYSLEVKLENSRDFIGFLNKRNYEIININYEDVLKITFHSNRSVFDELKDLFYDKIKIVDEKIIPSLLEEKDE